MEFMLRIKLGNEAMQDAWDLSEALREIHIQPNDPFKGAEGIVYDRNGNKVGKWAITE